MKVPLLDLRAQYAAIRDEVRSAMDRVTESQHFILGPEVDAFEREIALYTGAAHAVGMSSGTDALLAALMAIDVGPGDEVITTPFTFFATAGVIARLGATPVFVDIDPRSFNIDAAAIDAVVTDRTRAIIPVHLFGRMADMDPIMAIAARTGAYVIEDAAQAIGAFDHAGRKAGAVGHMAAFSFFPSKNLGGFGDGGMVTTSDDALAHRLRLLRMHGMEPKYHHAFVGGNFRLDALQAAVLRVKLPHLDAWTAGRRRNADRYRQLMSASGLHPVLLPDDVPGHVYNQFVVRIPERDRVRGALAEAGVGTEIYYPVPLHRQECFAWLGHAAGSFPGAERAAAEVLALPVYPELSPAQVEAVVAVLEAALMGTLEAEVCE
jgi:dTDP-4-amino-4,6-dideoxygalactose transaminase